MKGGVGWVVAQRPLLDTFGRSNLEPGGGERSKVVQKSIEKVVW